MERLVTFEQFVENKAKQVQAQIEEEMSAKREASANSFKNLLAEFGVASMSELSEEDKLKFNERLGALTESLELNERLNKSDVQYQLQNDYGGNTAPKVTKLNKKKLEVKYGHKVSPQSVIDSIKELYPEVELEHIEWRALMSGGGIHSFAIKESVDVNEAKPRISLEDFFNDNIEKYKTESSFIKAAVKMGFKKEDVISIIDDVEQGGDSYTKFSRDIFNESVVTEAEIKSDDEFKEYAFTVLQKAFGEDFDEAKAQEVVDGILGKADGDYGKAAGILQASLG